jgi:O-antigen/teichoic acid export membrane protein
VGYFGFFDFGLSSAVSRFVSRAYGKSDQNEANRVISNALFLFTLLAAIVGVISIALAFIGPHFLEENDRVVFRDCILIMGLTFGISFPIRAFTGTLFAQLRHSLFALSELAGLIVRFTLVMILVNKGGELRTIAMVNALAQLISCSLVCYFFISSQKTFRLSSPSKSCIKELFQYSAVTSASQIADLIRFRLSPMIITAHLGFSLVTLYNIADRLMDYFIQMVLSLLGTLSPYFSRLEGENNSQDMREKFILFSKFTAVFTMLVGCGIFLFGKAFIEKWMGPEYLKAFTVLQILTIAYCTALMQTTTGQLMYGISKHKFVAGITWGEALLNLSLCIFLVNKYGLFGIALGVAIPMLIFKGIIQPIFICKIMKFSMIDYYISIFLRPVLAALLYSVLFWKIVGSAIRPDYLNILILSTSFSFGYVIVALFFGLDKKSRSVIIHQIQLFIRSIINKKPAFVEVS